MLVDRDNYYSPDINWKYMSVSQFKDFLKCPAMAIAKLREEYEEEKPTCFLQGSYVDAWNNGELEQFKENHPELYSSRGNTKGELKSEFKILNDCINTLETDSWAMKFLEGEHQVIFTAELFGCQWKINIDSYNPAKGIFTDLKCVKDFNKVWYEEDRMYVNFVEGYDYHLQMAIYQEVEKIATDGKGCFPYIVAVTKQNPPDKAIIKFDEDALKYQLYRAKQELPLFLEYKSGKEPLRCGKCDYCRKTKQINKIIHYSEL